jgi:hypothetical protein
MDLGYSIGTWSFPENSFPDVLKHPNSGACQSKKILNTNCHPKKQRLTLAKGNVDPKFQEKIPAGTLQSSKRRPQVEPPILAAKHLLFFFIGDIMSHLNVFTIFHGWWIPWFHHFCCLKIPTPQHILNVQRTITKRSAKKTSIISTKNMLSPSVSSPISKQFPASNPQNLGYAQHPKFHGWKHLNHKSQMFVHKIHQSIHQKH